MVAETDTHGSNITLVSYLRRGSFEKWRIVDFRGTVERMLNDVPTLMNCGITVPIIGLLFSSHLNSSFPG